jgi:hypothetical protein
MASSSSVISLNQESPTDRTLSSNPTPMWGDILARRPRVFICRDKEITMKENCCETSIHYWCGNDAVW